MKRFRKVASFGSIRQDFVLPGCSGGFMYAALRQVKAKSGTADELAARVKRGAIPIISNVPGFLGYYVVIRRTIQ